ncbi:MAG: (2Fe-2S) ferredoxin domain-containing protein [Aeromicrobium erythreum]
MRRVVHVAMSVHEAREQDVLRRAADAVGATLAFLQHGSPSLVAELDRLAAGGASEVELVRIEVGGTAPARSWVRRVAGHWVRAGRERPEVVIDGRPVTGSEAPLRSPAWEGVPGHRHHVLVCRGPRCWAQGADQVSAALDTALGEAGLGDDDVLVTQTGCLFPCNQAPVLVLHPDDEWYGRLGADAASRLVTERIVEHRTLDEHRLLREKHEM